MRDSIPPTTALQESNRCSEERLTALEKLVFNVEVERKEGEQ